MALLHRSHPSFSKAIIWFLLITAACTQEPTLPFFNGPDFTPEWIGENELGYDSIHSVPEFSLLNQDGDTISEIDLDGKITVADFFFTSCPGICPRLTRSMRTLQEKFKSDSRIILVSHSVTPDIDSIPRLKQYAETYKVESGKWHLLTGDREKIYKLARAGYYADEDIGLSKGPDDFLHTENFILLDNFRRIRGVYQGTNPAEIERLIEDILILKQEVK